MLDLCRGAARSRAGCATSWLPTRTLHLKVDRLVDRLVDLQRRCLETLSITTQLSFQMCSNILQSIIQNMSTLVNNFQFHKSPIRKSIHQFIITKSIKQCLLFPCVERISHLGIYESFPWPDRSTRLLAALREGALSSAGVGRLSEPWTALGS